MQIIKDLLNLFFPKVCVSCNNLLLEHEDLICHHCQSDLPFTMFSFGTDNPVFERLSTIVNIEAATSLLRFNKSEITKELLHKLKYKNRQKLGAFFAEVLVASHGKELLSANIDLIVPIPLHPKKLKKRGYNQLTVFGQTIANKCNLNYRNVLEKTINNPSQTTKTAAQRRQNVAKVFKVINPEKYQGKHFLVIDDVMTTGATIESAVETILQQVPNAKVSVATIAVVL